MNKDAFRYLPNDFLPTIKELVSKYANELEAIEDEPTDENIRSLIPMFDELTAKYDLIFYVSSDQIFSNVPRPAEFLIDFGTTQYLKLFFKDYPELGMFSATYWCDKLDRKGSADPVLEGDFTDCMHLYNYIFSYGFGVLPAYRSI